MNFPQKTLYSSILIASVCFRSRGVDFAINTRYIKNSLKIDSLQMETICAAAKDDNITVALGFSENFHDSIYIAQAVIGPDGQILMHRRKIKPTHMERTVFGDATGDSLKNVVDTPIGRVGMLACWEHTQPLLKYHTHLQREAIHISAWPPLYPHDGGPGLWSMTKEGKQSTILNPW